MLSSPGYHPLCQVYCRVRLWTRLERLTLSITEALRLVKSWLLRSRSGGQMRACDSAYILLRKVQLISAQSAGLWDDGDKCVCRFHHVPWPDPLIIDTRGPVVPVSDIRIVHPETRKDLPAGGIGLMLLRGPQIMKCYYGNEGAPMKYREMQGY